ncbi:MAG: serine/threonine-protein kinase [Acidiferrobacterales bacterium]
MAKDQKKEKLPEIPGFRVLRVLGRGGMATVYLGVQQSMEREVAIKIMLPQLLTDPSFGDRFLREARIAAKLAHPHIVAVIDVGVSGDLYYMAMEYHPGGDLKAKIRKGLGQKQSIRIMKEIALALNYAQQSGFVHRDIKPDNILFSRSGSAVLSDFGIARAADGSTQLTATGSVVGTPHYMSPEQAQGKPVDGRSDLYSLGIMFYQMLVGKVPFHGDSALSIGIKHIRDPVPKLPEGLAKYQTFLGKLLAKNPDERWQTGADVVRTLEVLEADKTAAGGDTLAATAISGEAIQATQVVGTSVTGKPGKKSGLVVTLSILLVAGIGGFIAFQKGFLGGSTEQPANGQEVVSAQRDSADLPTAGDGVTDKVARLILDAQADYAAGRYFEPGSSNANQKFQAVLVIDKDNQSAKEGLRNIGTIYIANAEEAISANQFDQATTALTLAQRADSTNPKLAVVNAELDASKAAYARTQRRVARAKRARTQTRPTRMDPAAAKLASYLQQAADLLSPARLSERRLQSATRKYESAYAMAPRNRRVRRLREQIASGYEVLADELRLQKKWDEANRLVGKGLSLMRDHRGLKTLVAKIESDKAAARQPSGRRRAFGGF